MNKTNFQIYDVFGIFFPGATAIFGFMIFYPNLSDIIPNSDIGNITFLVILSFIAGHLIRRVSSVYVKYYYFIKNYSTAEIKKREFDKLPKEQRDQIIEGLKSHYGFTNINQRDIESLCISPVYDRMATRNTFISIADFQRSLSLLFCICGLVSLFNFVFTGLSSFTFKYYLLVGSAFFFLCSHLFMKGYVEYTRHAIKVVYFTFLSWLNEHK